MSAEDPRKSMDAQGARFAGLVYEVVLARDHHPQLSRVRVPYCCHPLYHAALHPSATQSPIHGSCPGPKIRIIIGSKKAIACAINNHKVLQRNTMLKEGLQAHCIHGVFIGFNTGSVYKYAHIPANLYEPRKRPRTPACSSSRRFSGQFRLVSFYGHQGPLKAAGLCGEKEEQRSVMNNP